MLLRKMVYWLTTPFFSDGSNSDTHLLAIGLEFLLLHIRFENSHLVVQNVKVLSLFFRCVARKIVSIILWVCDTKLSTSTLQELCQNPFMFPLWSRSIFNMIVLSWNFGDNCSIWTAYSHEMSPHLGNYLHRIFSLRQSFALSVDNSSTWQSLSEKLSPNQGSLNRLTQSPRHNVSLWKKIHLTDFLSHS